MYNVALPCTHHQQVTSNSAHQVGGGIAWPELEHRGWHCFRQQLATPCWSSRSLLLLSQPQDLTQATSDLQGYPRREAHLHQRCPGRWEGLVKYLMKLNHHGYTHTHTHMGAPSLFGDEDTLSRRVQGHEDCRTLQHDLESL